VRDYIYEFEDGSKKPIAILPTQLIQELLHIELDITDPDVIEENIRFRLEIELIARRLIVS
jgi:hypothetical protein